MPTTIAFAFPWGRYHATPWGHHVNEGAVEWPPSPWRILRALYATWRGRAPELPEEVVHRVLDALAEPPDYLLPERFVQTHTRHYMPDADTSPKPKRTKAFDNCVVFDPGAEVLVTWPTDLGGEERDALGRLVELLPYLGRTESLCEARLADGRRPAGTHAPYAPIGADGDAAAPAGTLPLLVPRRPLDLATLTTRTTEVRAARLVDPPGAYRLFYARPEPFEPRTVAPGRGDPGRGRRPRAQPDALRWAITSPALSGVHAAVAVADAARAACMGRYGVRNGGGASPVLAGKDASADRLQEGHRHAHYLAVDIDGDRLLDTLVLWAPGGIGERELAAVAGIRKLVGFKGDRDARPVRLGLEAVGQVAEVARELVGPARVWRSHTPFAPPRHQHRRDTWEEHLHAEIGRELAHRGIAASPAVEVIPGGWLHYRRRRLGVPLEQSHRAAGLELRFPEPIEGPLSLGALSHFSLGLFLPSSDPDSEQE